MKQEQVLLRDFPLEKHLILRAYAISKRVRVTKVYEEAVDLYIKNVICKSA